jgi:hypothetical protein
MTSPRPKPTVISPLTIHAGHTGVYAMRARVISRVPRACSPAMNAQVKFASL